MRATTAIEFWRAGKQVATPRVIINQTADPDLTDAWDTVVAAVTAAYYGITGDWQKAAATASTQIQTVYNGKDVTKNDTGAFALTHQGQVMGLPQPVDALAIRYRAWSDDDLTKRFGSVDPAKVGDIPIFDLGEESWNEGDKHLYERLFMVPVTSLPSNTKLAFAFGCGDNGWFFDVALSCVLQLVITPAPLDNVSITDPRKIALIPGKIPTRLKVQQQPQNK